MKNKLKKWPSNWIEHVTETCFFYFENNNIFFKDSKILCSNKTKNAKIYGIILTFKKYENIYDIFINHKSSTFIINYYYKDYYKFKESFSFIIETFETFNSLIKGNNLKGGDNMGLFSYFDLGGQATRDHITTAYDISQSIESTINCHSDKDCGEDGEDDEDGENDPVEPISPSNTMKLELMNC